MNTFKALVKREYLDGKNGYLYVPVILALLMLGITTIAVLGSGHILEINGVMVDGQEAGKYNLAEMIEHVKSSKEAEDLPAAVAILYWGLGILVWVAFPFVVFFSLLGSLYEERRDRSILFWKSMPTSDVQEVLAKLFMSVIGVFFIYLGVTIVLEIALALILGLTVLVQGGNMLDMWPVSYMVQGWIHAIPHYFLLALWALPIFSWLMIVSAYAPRMTFMYAVLPPVVLIILEEMLFGTARIAHWIGTHILGWLDGVDWRHFEGDVDGPKELFSRIHEMPLWDMVVMSVTDLSFWSGVVLSGLFIYGAIELRKRAI
ncbi:hypothetical protein GCM10017044_18630 [Kordiimonas sediminis]|uniref:Uncharacterized protein n=1 Tax=Kordiimonas sediminis TaxID=1735581 RepID=A0A919AUK2_9PROT|nr:hypothetical protein [Kordiimonas sediminis]GHF24285.1 hypothetical protein GCM10017044_18630 [Kordiimonas sediminis]